MFKVKKLSKRSYAVVVVKKMGALTVSLPVYEVSGGRDPQHDCKMVARDMNKAWNKTMRFMHNRF